MSEKNITDEQIKEVQDLIDLEKYITEIGMVHWRAGEAEKLEKNKKVFRIVQDLRAEVMISHRKDDTTVIVCPNTLEHIANLPEERLIHMPANEANIVVVSIWSDFHLQGNDTVLGILDKVHDGKFYVRGSSSAYTHCRMIDRKTNFAKLQKKEDKC